MRWKKTCLIIHFLGTTKLCILSICSLKKAFLLWKNSTYTEVVRRILVSVYPSASTVDGVTWSVCLISSHLTPLYYFDVSPRNHMISSINVSVCIFKKLRLFLKNVFLMPLFYPKENWQYFLEYHKQSTWCSDVYVYNLCP